MLMPPCTQARAQQACKWRFANKILKMTATSATTGATYCVHEGATQANSTQFKDNAAVRKNEAYDRWNQATDSKQNWS